MKTPASTQSSRSLGLAVLVGVLGAAGAFWLGRVTAPHTPSANGPTAGVADAAPRAPSPRPPAERRATPTTPAGPAADPEATLAASEAEIVDLLNRFKAQRPNDLTPELLAVIAWANQADADELALFVAYGKAMLPDNIYHNGLVLPLAFTRWAELDPRAGLEAYLALDEEERSSEIASILFGTWVLKGSPHDALDHALALPRAKDGDIFETADLVSTMLERLAAQNPAQASEIAAELARSEDPAEREAAQRARGALVETWLDKADAEKTLAWIDTWPDAAARDEMRQSVVDKLMNGDEAAQRAGVELFNRLGKPDNGTTFRIAAQKAQANPAEARAWALTLPPGNTRAIALKGVVETMTGTDQTPQAVAWLESQPPHPDHDSAYASLAVSAVERGQDYAAALRFTKKITDPESARRARAELIERWLSNDAERAVHVLGPAMEAADFDAPK